MMSNQFKMPKKRILESCIEGYLVQKCSERGWLCEKFTSPGKRSVPDRIISIPGGRVVFCEVKAPGKKPTKLQLIDHRTRKNLGHIVVVVDTKAAVDHVMKSLDDVYQQLRME